MNATLPLKFPKKYIRKQTTMNMLSETKYKYNGINVVKIRRDRSSGILGMLTGARFLRKPPQSGDWPEKGYFTVCQGKPLLPCP